MSLSVPQQLFPIRHLRVSASLGCSTWLPPGLCQEKTSFTSILLQASTLITTHFSHHLEAVSALVTTVFLCSVTVYQVPTAGSPLCLGVGDRGSQGRQDHSQQPLLQAHVTPTMDSPLFPSFCSPSPDLLLRISPESRVTASLCSDSPTAWLV